MNVINISIKIKPCTLSEVREILETIRKIEKEHSCNCTLLEVEVQN